jgi:hypothetical protein
VYYGIALNLFPDVNMVPEYPKFSKKEGIVFQRLKYFSLPPLLIGITQINMIPRNIFLSQVSFGTILTASKKSEH